MLERTVTLTIVDGASHFGHRAIFKVEEGPVNGGGSRDTAVIVEALAAGGASTPTDRGKIVWATVRPHTR